MFKIGDKVSHPAFGVGDIKKIEEKNFLGKKQKYYILKLMVNEMTLMIPVNRAKEIGLRHIINPKTVPEVLSVLGDKVDNEMEENYKHRIKSQSEMVDSGDILKVAQVVKNYIHLDNRDKLSTTEKGLYERARKILESEISAACNIEKSKVKFMIKEAINKGRVGKAERKNH
ncbi:MAG TPA: CarD family transcriptional regulator [Candidatus Atribacteria bacterium]|nr:CarD family transcriptional regulator [Candidatus Atribacteria bacterium]